VSDPSVNIDNLIASVNAASNLDPAVHVAIASTAPDAATAATNAQATAAYAQATTHANQLKTMSVGAQLQAWNAMPSDQQSQLRSVGYAPPPQPRHGGGGLLGDIGGAFSEVGSALGTAAHDVLNAAGSSTRLVQHTYRTLDVLHLQAEGQTAAQQEAQQGAKTALHPTFNPGGLKLAFSPGAWANAWDSTEHGERTYNPAIVRQLTNQYGDGTVSTAKAIASTNLDPKKLQALSNYPVLQQQWQSDPDLQAAVKSLLGSKISFGRSLVGEKFTLDHPAAAAAISGPVDAAFDFFGDPLNVPLGVGADALRAHFAISSGADVYRLAGIDPTTLEATGKADPAVAHALNQAAGYIADKDPQGLYNRFTMLKGAQASLDSAIRSGAVHDKGTFVKWLAEQADMSAVASGQAFKVQRAGQEMLHATPLSDAAALAKARSADAIDFLTNVPGLGKAFHPVQSLTKLIPQGNAISPTSDIAATQFRDMIGLVLPRAQADALSNQWRLGSVAEKRTLYYSTLQEIFQTTGWYDNPKTAARAREFLQQVMEDPSHEVYTSVPGLSDKLMIDGKIKATGGLGTQVMGSWPMPDPATLLAQKNKITLGGKALNLINNDGIDAFMQEGWKPLQLLRLGFAPRVAGEEAFGAMLRDGFTGLARARLAASAVQGEMADSVARQKFIDEYNALEQKVLMAEKNSVTEPFTAEQQRLLAGDDWKQFSEARGYTQSQIRDFQKFMDMHKGVDLDTFEGWRSVPFPKGSPNEGEEAASIDPGLLYDAKRIRSEDRILPWHPLHGALAALSDHLPEGTVRDIVSGQNPARELFAQVVGDSARKAFRNVEGRLAGQEYTQAARELYDQFGPSLLADQITAVHAGHVDYLDSGNNQLRASKRGLERRTAAIVADSGAYKGYAPTDPLYLQVYKRDLEEIANDYLARNALRGFGNRDQQVADVVQAIESPQARGIREAASRYSVLRDGRTVGVDATQDEATRDWANWVVDHVNGYLTDTSGQPIADLADVLRTGKAPTVDQLAEIPKDRLPAAVHGPETVAIAPPSAYQQHLQQGFHQLVGRPMNWMARQPMFVHNYVLAKRDLQGLADTLGAGEGTDALIRDRAIAQAVNRTLPFIHDPAVRSALSTNMRNLMPFEFAQEQFYKRWARTMAYAPDAFRKAVLLNAGLAHSGLTHTDSNGNEYFDYPLISQLQAEVLNPVLNGLLGYNAMMPVNSGFAGEVKNVSPGLSHIGPSFGPLISIPTKWLANRYPELQPVNQAVEGQAGANTPYLEQMIPASLYRFGAAFDTSSATYASAEASAIQALEASGHGLPDNATRGEQQAYLDRLKNYTRITVLLRGVLGFVGPTAPTITPGRQDIPKRLGTLLQTMPIQQATAELVREYGPEATPYTVFKSTTPGKADLPAAQSTLSMLNDNIGFFSKYPLAGGWLLPSVSDSGKFSDSAYLEQLAMGMRERKTPSKMLDDVVYARDAPYYYQNLDTYEKLKLQYTNNYTQKLKVENAWADWQAQYFKAHPVFGDQVQNSTSATDRGDILAEMQKALADPSLPATPTSQAIGGLVQNYVNFQAMQAKYKALHTTAGSRALANLENAFATWADNYVKANPEATVFYQRIVRPDVGGPAAQADILAGDQAAAAADQVAPITAAS